MDGRSLVEQAVFNHPGITFREIERETGLAVGTIQYHLHKDDRILKRGGGYVACTYDRECPLSEACQGRCLWKVLRDETTHDILLGLEQGKTQNEMAQDLDLAQSTINYHVKRLRKWGAIVDNEPADVLKEVL